MNVNTTDAKPLGDLLVRFQKDGQTIVLDGEHDHVARAFHDGSNACQFWYELKPGLFWCGWDFENAKSIRRQTTGIPLSKLYGLFPEIRQLDLWSSASVQHYIETGEYLRVGESENY